MKESDPDLMMIFSVWEKSLIKRIGDECEARMSKILAPPPAEEYFHGLKELAHYLQAGISFAGKIEKMLPPGASHRAGKTIKIKKSAVDQLISEGKVR